MQSDKRFRAGRTWLVVPLLTWACGQGRAADLARVLPAGQLPDDARLGKLKDLDGYFPFLPSTTPADWERRAERVRRQILVALGLWPLPTKTPPRAVVHGRVERDTFTVDRVFFESFPGHYVTGSLFRPVGRSGKLPGVLCPHGHWSNGRFYDRGPEGIKADLASGAEKYEVSGRYPLQARCVQLARMGCVVFHYDMLGNADSQQISQALAHGFARQRPEFAAAESWGFYSPQAELRAQNIMGLQTYNSIRALDWLTSLDDVDPQRIGVTGASGGGTQTFMLAAIDPRPKVAFPAVMVSTAMQGGCTCENASLLRIGTGNIEFAALMAPRALGMSAANDWTKEIETKGLPELQRHYALLGVPQRVMARAFLHFDHNYNYPSRAVMYEWFNEHLALGARSPIVEEDFRPLSHEELTVWTGEFTRPVGGEAHERALTRWLADDAAQQIATWTPRDAATWRKFRELAGGAVDVLVGRGLPAPGEVEQDLIDEHDQGDSLRFQALLRHRGAGEELPVVFLYPKKWNRRVVIWLTEQGKAGLFSAAGSPLPHLQRLLAGGTAVAGVDLLYQGEFLADGQPLQESRKVENPREFAGYTLGYNHPLLAQRAHDVLTVLSYCRNFAEHRPERVDLVALDRAALPAAAAAAQAGAAVGRLALDTQGFRFARDVASIRDVNLLPGIVKYGDLPVLLALSAPTPLWLAGETSVPELVRAAYQAAAAPDKLLLHDGPQQHRAEAVVDWLLKQ